MFSAETLQFLRDLRDNNDRAWFDANRARWERHGKSALAAFVEAFRPHLAALSPHYVADARSAFRIHRDTRFSKDKSPYKTHLAAQFRHAAVRGGIGDAVHAPGFYCHIAPDGPGAMDGCFAGFGAWHPEPAALRAIRRHIVSFPEAWAEARRGLRLVGDALQRVPSGFDPAHPHADDLRRKDFIAVVDFTEAEVCAPDFVERYANAARSGSPMMKFLCDASALQW